MPKEKKNRKKFKDTKVGVFLKEKAPKILDGISDVLTNCGSNWVNCIHAIFYLLLKI